MVISTIKSCIFKPVEHFNLYSLSALSSLYPRLKRRMMKKFPMRFLAYWGILVVEAAIIKKDLSRRGHSCTKTDTICLTWVLYFSTHFNRGNPPLSLNIQRKGSASHGSQSPVNGSSNKRFKRVTAVCHGQSYQKDKASMQQRRVVPTNVKKVALCSKMYYSIPGANGCQFTMNGSKLARPMNTDAVKKYFVKKNDEAR